MVLSTIEAEYIIATRACKEKIWLRRLMKELVHKQEKILLYCGSQSVLHNVRNPTFHSTTKHIDVLYYFIHEVIEDKYVDFQKIHTKKHK